MLLDRIQGHEPSKWYIQRMVAEGTLPPCLLLHGPKGVGKHALAIELAKALNCGRDLCSCPICTKIDTGTHLDVFEYTPEGKTGYLIEQVRGLIDESARSPVEGSWRLFLIDEADKLPPKTADALLKTIEDGAKNTLFILMASDKNLLPGTLVSRSLSFYMGELTPVQVQVVLSRLYPETPTGVLKNASLLSAGSVSQAERFLDVESMEVRDKVLSILSKYPNVPDFEVLEFVDEHKEDLTELVDFFSSILSDVCLMVQGLDKFVQNAERTSEMLPIKRAFGSSSIDALVRIRLLKDRLQEPVALGHQFKSALIDLKRISS